MRNGNGLHIGSNAKHYSNIQLHRYVFFYIKIILKNLHSPVLIQEFYFDEIHKNFRVISSSLLQ